MKKLIFKVDWPGLLKYGNIFNELSSKRESGIIERAKSISVDPDYIIIIFDYI